MRKTVNILILLAIALSMLTVPALADPAPATTTDTVLPTTVSDPSATVDTMTDKAIKLGTALVPLMMIIAAVVLMFSAKFGKMMIVIAICGAAIILGGYKLIVDAIQYFVS